MKKYKVTKKHPELAQGIKFQENDINCYLKELWLDHGWIKEVKEKVWVVDKSDNWKLKKTKKDCISKDYFDKWVFASKKEALEHVFNEAKERFIKEKNYPKTIQDLEAFAPDIHYFTDDEGEICSVREKIHFKNKIAALTEKSAIALMQLTELIKFRDLWWQVDNWKPDWSENLQIKFTIQNKQCKLCIVEEDVYSRPLAFETKEIAKDFLKSFQEQIEIAKELL